MSKTLAITGLVLNIVILPGLGTLINKKIRNGVLQIILFVVGFVLAFAGAAGAIFSFLFLLLALIGLILVFFSYIWAVVDGIKLIIHSI